MPEALDHSRLVRQWTILLVLLRHRFGAPLARLREATGVSRITIWRDLRALEAAGIPLEETTVNGERRISVRASDLPALVLTPLQIQALELSRRLLGPLSGTALLDAYDEILLRLGRPIRAAAASPAEARTAEFRRRLDAAVARRAAVRIQFVNVGEAEPRPRDVEPLGWRFVRNELYLLAHDRARDAQRSFASSRIRGVEPLGAPAVHALEDPHAPLFAAADTLETLPPVDVEIDLSPVAAAHLAARPLGGVVAEAARPDGSLRLTARVAGLWATADWVVGWGPEARAVAPPELVALVRDRLARALAGYAADAGPDEPVAPPSPRARRR